MPGKDEDDFYRFCVKNALVASSLSFVVGVQMRTVVSTLVDTLIDPLLSFDLDQNGEPDMEQIKRLHVDIGGYRFHIGKLVADVVKTALTILVVYWIVTTAARYTGLLHDELVGG